MAFSQINHIFCPKYVYHTHRRMNTIQIVSDLHLEFREGKIAVIKPSAPILCLLGDICACGTIENFRVFLQFIKWAHSQYKLILHVAGNHEFYSSTMPATGMSNTMPIIIARFQKIMTKLPRYKFLHNQRVKVGDILFIGSTLWSDIPAEYAPIAKASMNDYSHIYTSSGRLTPEDVTKMHGAAVKFIERSITFAKSRKLRCVLLTHHKPTRESTVPITRYCYESDLGRILRAPIVLAAYGHTHVHADRTVGGVRIYSNPCGYPREHTKFEPAAIVNLSDSTRITSARLASAKK